MPISSGSGSNTPLHILVLPKWWPNAKDPQLGDFIRKQVQSVNELAKVTVLLVEGASASAALEAGEVDGLFVIRSTYVANEHTLGPVRKAINLVRYWRAAKRGWSLVLGERGLPALVHMHILVRPALLARWIKRKHGVPYILSEQSSEYLDGTYASKGPFFHWFNRRVFGGAAAVTAVSAWLGEGLKTLGLCERYVVVPNVIPGLDRPLPARGPAGHFLVVADLVDRTKNVSGVIRALARVSKHGAPVQLTIIGDGPDRAMLEELARSEGVASITSFLGRLPNSAVLDHVAKAGSVIINSNVETFSVVTGEGLAQGKTVIATRCGGPQAFINPQNGLLIEIGDTMGLAAAMEQIRTAHSNYDPERIRADLATRFSPGAVGQAFVDLYRSTLELHS